MNHKAFICCLAVALLAGVACAGHKSTANTATSTNATHGTIPPANKRNSTSSDANQTTPSSESVPTSKGKQNFTLVNQTGGDIFNVFISPHSANDWQDDILARNIQINGESVGIKFHRNEKDAMWDLRVENRAGQLIEWENLNLLENSKVTLYYQDGQATAKVE